MIKRIARFLIEFPLCMFIVETVCFVCGWHITMLPFIIAFVGMLGCELWVTKNNHERVTFFFAAIAIVLLSIVLMTAVYDTSYDGQWYHSAVILLQNQRWNPFYAPIITAATEPYGADTHLWVSHYAKGMETIQTGFVAITDNLESGKTLNLLFTLSMTGYVFLFLKQILPNKRTWVIIMITLLFILNPVLINQFFSHYIDYTCYVFIVIGCILLYDVIINRELRSVFTLLLVGFFVPTIKMNIAFWVISIMVIFLIYIWIRYKRFDRSLFVKMVVAVLMGFVVGGFNPYITNIRLKGNILYPLDESKREMVERASMPEMMWGKNRLYQVNSSLAVNPYNNDVKRHGNTHIFYISKEDVMDSARHDVQLGGFGIFFFEAIIVLLILFFSFPKTREWLYTGLGILILYLALFLLPSGSLARYVPFFYLVPLLIIIYAFSQEKKNTFQQAILSVSVIFLLLNATISIVGSTAMAVQQRLQYDYIVKELKDYNQMVYVKSSSCQFYDKLDKADVKYTLEKPEGKQLYKIDMVGCDPIVDVPPTVFKKEEQPYLMKKISLFQPKIEKY